MCACSKIVSTLAHTFTARAEDVNPTLAENQKNSYAFGGKDLPCFGKQRDLD